MSTLNITVILAGTGERNVTSVRFLVWNVRRCSLVDRYQCVRAVCKPNYRNAILMWKQRFLRNVHENITSHKVQEVWRGLHDNMSYTKCSNKGVPYVKLQYVACRDAGEHTVTQANVDRCALPCVIAYTNL